MKHYFLFLILFLSLKVTAQTEATLGKPGIALGANSTSTDFMFNYKNFLIPHYGVSWYMDQDQPGAPTGYLSGFGGLKFFTGGADRVIINTAGNVAIGVPDAKGFKLAVGGGIVAESVTVKLKELWPDFVFHTNYQLPTLLEIKNYIQDNGHLPGVPSAAEVKEKGVDLGQMNAKLLEKIEELTLHLIEKDNEINLINKLNQDYDKRLKALEAKIDKK